jgi:hypothetical protein
LYSGFKRSSQVLGTFLTMSVFTVKAKAPQYAADQRPSGSLA